MHHLGMHRNVTRAVGGGVSLPSEGNSLSHGRKARKHTFSLMFQLSHPFLEPIGHAHTHTFTHTYIHTHTYTRTQMSRDVESPERPTGCLPL